MYFPLVGRSSVYIVPPEMRFASPEAIVPSLLALMVYVVCPVVASLVDVTVTRLPCVIFVESPVMTFLPGSVMLRRSFKLVISLVRVDKSAAFFLTCVSNLLRFPATVVPDVIVPIVVFRAESAVVLVPSWISSCFRFAAVVLSALTYFNFSDVSATGRSSL